MTADEVMTADPFSLNPTDTVGRALEMLREYDVRHVLVTERGRLVGMLSDRDLRSFALPPLASIEHADDARARMRAPLSTLMSANTMTVGPDEDVTDVVDLMLEQKVGAVPVVDPATDELQGIISYIDVLRASRDLW